VSVAIGDDLISSDLSKHSARLVDGSWFTSWHPSLALSYNQAITAMVLADMLGRQPVGLCDDPVWIHVEGWAAELGLSGAAAVVFIAEPPAW
jgi:hypothetical protein